MSKANADKQLEEAFEKYSKALEKYCRVRLGEISESANDCVQEAFCVYYKRLLNGEQFENPRAFLYKTANNMVLRAKEEYFKSLKHIKALDDAENVAVYDEEIFDKDIDLDIDAVKDILISKLSDSEKELYQMKYVQGKSLKEIGEYLNIPPSAVANRTSRLRSKVHKLVQPVLTEFRKGGS